MPSAVIPINLITPLQEHRLTTSNPKSAGLPNNWQNENYNLKSDYY